MFRWEILSVMKQSKSRTHQGFSLIETIVAILIITTGLLMMAHLMTVSIAMHERTEFDLKSVQLAQGKMESLKAQFAAFLDSGQLPADLVSGSHGPESAYIQTNEYSTQNYLHFDMSWDVVDLSGGLKQVTLSVNPISFQEGLDGMGSASTDSVTITSVLAP